MSTASPILTLLKADLSNSANQSLGMALGGVLNTVADATKGFIAYHAGIKDAMILVDSAMNWLSANPNSTELPTTFAPAPPPSAVAGSTPINDTVVVSADGSAPAVAQ